MAAMVSQRGVGPRVVDVVGDLAQGRPDVGYGNPDGRDRLYEGIAGVHG